MPFLLLVVLALLNFLTFAAYGNRSEDLATITTTQSAIPENISNTNLTRMATTTLHTTTQTSLLNSTFEIRAEPSTLTILSGTSGFYAITVISKDGLVDNVQLEVKGLPNGVEGFFNLESGIASPIFTSILTIKASSTAQTGTNLISIVGKRNGEVNTKSVNLIITGELITTTTTLTNETVEPSQGFILHAEPQTIRLPKAGISAIYDITVSSLGSFDGSVILGVHGLPKGTIPIFNPSEGRPTPIFASKLRIRTSSDTPAGTYSLFISGAHGKLVHFITVYLIIESASSISTTTTSTLPSSDLLTLSTSTSKSNYNQGEICQIFGYVKTKFGITVTGASISIQVVDPNGDIIFDPKTKTDGSGYYSSQFILPDSATTGTYTIYITASKIGYRNGFSYYVFSVGESLTPSITIESLYTTSPDEAEQEEFSAGQTVVIWVIVKNAGAELKKARIWIEVTDPSGIPITILITVQDLRKGEEIRSGLQFTLNPEAPEGAYKVSSFVSTGLISEGGKFLANKQTLFIVS